MQSVNIAQYLPEVLTPLLTLYTRHSNSPSIPLVFLEHTIPLLQAVPCLMGCSLLMCPHFSMMQVPCRTGNVSERGHEALVLEGLSGHPSPSLRSLWWEQIYVRWQQSAPGPELLSSSCSPRQWCWQEESLVREKCWGMSRSHKATEQPASLGIAQ